MSIPAGTTAALWPTVGGTGAGPFEAVAFCCGDAVAPFSIIRLPLFEGTHKKALRLRLFPSGRHAGVHSVRPAVFAGPGSAATGKRGENLPCLGPHRDRESFLCFRVECFFEAGRLMFWPKEPGCRSGFFPGPLPPGFLSVGCGFCSCGVWSALQKAHGLLLTFSPWAA